MLKIFASLSFFMGACCIESDDSVVMNCTKASEEFDVCGFQFDPNTRDGLVCPPGELCSCMSSGIEVTTCVDPIK